jgi:NAD(P)-dependent dehydrogenase (short-subunit alcohol dehydrogenase family)
VNRWRSLGVADQYGKRAVITGANAGLGYQTALALAGAGAEVVLAVRDLDRGQAAALRIRDRLDDARVRVSYLDLADLASVRDFAAAQSSAGSLDLLVNNAGLMLTPRRERTREGFESQMGVNHLGHFALTAGLMPALRSAPAGRVVSVTSLSARRAKPLDRGLGLTGKYTPMTAYSQSKLAVALFAEELDRRLRRADSTVISVLTHPGWSATAEQPARGDNPGRSVKFARRATAMLGSSPASGAASEVYAGTSSLVAGGEFIGPRFLARGAPGPTKLPRRARDRKAADWLWAESARLTGVDPEFVDPQPISRPIPGLRRLPS